MTTNAEDRDEVKRRTQLEKFVSCPYYFPTLGLSSLAPWMTSGTGLRRCRIKDGRIGSSIRSEMLKQSSGSLMSFREQSSSTKYVLRVVVFMQG